MFRELLFLVKEGTITDKGGVEVLRAILDQLKESGRCETPRECVDRIGLKVLIISPEGPAGSGDPIVQAAKETIDENIQAVIDYRNGRKEALNFLVGQVMKKTRGCAKPADVNRILIDLIDKEG
jgi:aspartyl-tRNA(Asn)/glutamyl-tRNA(Gln) amidotransferase subunit B